jgi:hypothetical protein
MKEPGIYEGFTRNPETADTLEAIEDPEMEVKIREALAGRRASPTGRAWKRRGSVLRSEGRNERFQVGRWGVFGVFISRPENAACRRFIPNKPPRVRSRPWSPPSLFFGAPGIYQVGDEAVFGWLDFFHQAPPEPLELLFVQVALENAVLNPDAEVLADARHTLKPPGIADVVSDQSKHMTGSGLGTGVGNLRKGFHPPFGKHGRAG